jgi:hypothetical protein
MIDSWHISIWRVSVDALTLRIIKVELGVIVFHWQNWRDTNCGTFLCFIRLESLIVIVLTKTHIIDIVQERRVVFNTLMESLERVIQVLLFHYALCNCIQSKVDSSIQLIMVIADLVAINAAGFISSFKAYILNIFKIANNLKEAINCEHNIP